jgi:hypothetical protein
MHCYRFFLEPPAALADDDASCFSSSARWKNECAYTYPPPLTHTYIYTQRIPFVLKCGTGCISKVSTTATRLHDDENLPSGCEGEEASGSGADNHTWWGHQVGCGVGRGHESKESLIQTLHVFELIGLISLELVNL